MATLNIYNELEVDIFDGVITIYDQTRNLAFKMYEHAEYNDETVKAKFT